MIDQFELLLPANRDRVRRLVIDDLSGACREHRTAVVIAVHADHLGAAIAVPMLRAGIEDGVVVADGPGGNVDDH